MIKALFSYFKQHLMKNRYKIVPYHGAYMIFRRHWFRWERWQYKSCLQSDSSSMDGLIFDQPYTAMLAIHNYHKQRGESYIWLSVILEGE